MYFLIYVEKCSSIYRHSNLPQILCLLPFVNRTSMSTTMKYFQCCPLRRAEQLIYPDIYPHALQRFLFANCNLLMTLNCILYGHLLFLQILEPLQLAYLVLLYARINVKHESDCVKVNLGDEPKKLSSICLLTLKNAANPFLSHTKMLQGSISILSYRKFQVISSNRY